MPADPGAAGRTRPVVGTVRFRITALAAMAVVAVLVATGGGLILAQRRLLTENLEDNLRQRADEVAAAVSGGPVPGMLSSTEDILVQVTTADGRMLGGSPNSSGVPLGRPPATGQPETLHTIGSLPGHAEPFLLLTRRVRGREGVVVVQVAGPLDDVRDSTRALATVLSVAIPAVAALLAVLVWILVGRTLRPVEAIRAEVAAMTGTELGGRVPQPAGGDEIARLARTMNAMLDRVQGATERQQRFVADASHDLRSPLTRIRSELEVDLVHPGTGDLTATHRSVLDEISGLQDLVEDLLQLARSDAGAATRSDQPVDLDDLVLAEAARLRVGRQVEVDSTAVSGAQVRGDPGQLARAVRNLGDNAARHASARVILSLSERDHSAVLSIADDGPGIPADQHERVFERFTRLDDARTSGGGSGLGLAIARDILEHHHGTIAIDPDHYPGTRFVVTLPTGP